MNCQEYREMIEDALDVSLHGELAAHVRRHLEHCASCRDYFAARQSEHARLFAKVNVAYAHLRPPPPDFVVRLTREVGTRRTAQRSWRRFALPKWALIAASLALLAGFVLAATVVAEVVMAKGNGDETTDGADGTDGIAASMSDSPAATGEPSSQTGLDSSGNDVAIDSGTATSNDQTQDISTTQGETKMKSSTSIIGTFRRVMNSMASIVMMAAPVGSAATTNDGYIESEGDAFISLGHCAGPNTKMEVDFQLTELTLDTKPFGSWGDRLSIPMYSLYISHSGDDVLKFSWDSTDADGNRQAYNCNIADLKRHIISFDASTVTYASTNVTDGGAAYTHTFSKPFSGQRSPYPLAVFARGGDVPATQSGHFGGATKMKVYGVKIYESGALVKTYTPCIRDGIAGLKMTGPGVNAFVTGIDVTKVKYGGDILVEKDDPYLSTGKYNDATKAATAGECIYLDTGYIVKPTTRVELDFAPLTPNAAMSQYNHVPDFMYAKGSSPTCEIEFYGRTSTGYLGIMVGRYQSSSNPYRNTTAPLSTAYGIRRTASVVSNSMSLITAGYTNYTATVATGYEVNQELTTVPLRLCISNVGNNFAPMKIYGLKIYESDTLVKDYKPIVTNGVPGLVNVLNASDVRYTSTYGSNYALTFDAGGNFECTDGSDEAYLEFGGPSEFENRINTGIVVTKDSVIEADFALWNAKNPPNGQQHLIVQDGSDGILAWLYINSENRFSYLFKDYTDTSAVNAGISATNARRQFKFDGPNAKFTISEGDSVIYDTDMTGDRTRTGGSTTLKIGNANACMRLYGFKVTTANEVVRDFVPCVTNGASGLYDLIGKQFYPLAGSRVRGKGTKGKSEFIVEPTPIRIARKDGTGTLSCFVGAAQSYEWFENDVKIEGETGDSLTLEWTRQKPHVRTYSVRPVYTVFNETVRGEAATVQVEFIPLGTCISIR